MSEPTQPTLAGLPRWEMGEELDYDGDFVKAADLEAVLAVLRSQISEWRDEIDTDSPTSLEERMVEFWERQLGMQP